MEYDKIRINEQEAYTLSALLNWDELVNRDNIFKPTGELQCLRKVNKKLNSYCTQHSPEISLKNLAQLFKKRKTHYGIKSTNAKIQSIDVIEALEEPIKILRR